MSEQIKTAIEQVEAQIAAKEAEILSPLKITVNQLCQMIGEPARYEINGTGTVAGTVKRKAMEFRSDQFFGRPLAQCVTEYLETREAAGLPRTASMDDIFEALVKGGYKTDDGNEDFAKRGVKISLTKNTAQFAKVGENFGLKKWYPNSKPPPRKATANYGDVVPALSAVPTTATASETGAE